MKFKKEKKPVKKCFPIIDELEMDELVGYPNITLTGDRSAVISGVRFVNHLSEERIELDLDKINAEISGCGMKMVYIARGMVKIEGSICGICLERFSRRNNFGKTED